MVDIILISLGVILLLVGLVGCVLPALPGPPISYVALLLLHFTSAHQFSVEFLVIWAIVVIAVTVIDNVIPMWTTKKWGGGKRAVWGSMIGLVVGLFFFPPFGLIIGPFVGAVLGELSEGKAAGVAFKSGFGAFMGFVGGTILKLIVSGMIAFYFCKEIIIH